MEAGCHGGRGESDESDFVRRVRGGRGQCVHGQWPGPMTAWGKPSVSEGRLRHRCRHVHGPRGDAGHVGNGANTAGGINGSNGSARSTSTAVTPRWRAVRPAAAPRALRRPSAAAFTGTCASQDIVHRAATQQHPRQWPPSWRVKRALKSCLVERGYQEFALTPEQRAHLATLKVGSNEYLEYLYALGADASVVQQAGSLDEIVRQGTTSKAAVSRRPPSSKGTVPCQR